MSEQNISDVTEVPVTEKKYRGCRGPDKNPRKYNLKSYQNLRQNQKNSDLDNDIPRNIEKKPPYGLIALIVVIFLAILFVGPSIWEYLQRLFRKYAKITN